MAGKTLTEVANKSTTDKAYSLKLIDQESNLRGGVGDDSDDDDDDDDDDYDDNDDEVKDISVIIYFKNSRRA